MVITVKSVNRSITLYIALFYVGREHSKSALVLNSSIQYNKDYETLMRQTEDIKEKGVSGSCTERINNSLLLLKCLYYSKQLIDYMQFL